MGAGAIGVEFAYFYHTIGTEVTLVEYQPTILPVEDQDIGKELGKIYKKDRYEYSYRRNRRKSG